ncbi:hypothetical protein IQ235_02760 [Oscillatoriales cyanobacterium LEGE 11467]|uniref:Uncharacterized protein n=2 Tax=Zarconia TaxID=2992130 RepID=A0A928Z6N7_9CYAN|nr:hypothetical protein [Zarconia navalis LEGE 11467]
MSTQTLADPNIGNETLAKQWAKKYVQNLELETQDEQLSDRLKLAKVVSQEGRERTAQTLSNTLRLVSAQAWNKTEALLAKEVQRHHIDPRLINPWEIAADSFRIYDKVLAVYTQQGKPQNISVSVAMGAANGSAHFYEQEIEVQTDRIPPSRLATIVGGDIGTIRKKYTATDPRLIGFVSMQFHYTSQMLLELLSPVEQMLVGSYFKVIDDHLYMPLQRAYEAAANLDYNSPILQAVQHWLPLGTEIAVAVCDRAIEQYPHYTSYTGKLSNPTVKISSIRDVEMFQVYLWVCALESNIDVVQQELFPLCVMLYPPLKVNWELVRSLVQFLNEEVRDRLAPRDFKIFSSYLQSVKMMFSPEVLS